MELIVANLGTYHLLSSRTRVTAYRITGKRDSVLAWEVTTTKWLRVFVRTKANTYPSTHGHQNGLE